MDIKEKVKKLPLSPGVYIMKSKPGDILYVGKATCLRKRVNSYFSRSSSPKTDIFIEKVAVLDFIECSSPEQALILEAALIKEKKPKYNISLRDSKTYPYVEVTNEEFPRIFISRPRRKTGSLFFGPYPKVKPLRAALSMLRNVFPYRSCRGKPKKVCLSFHLHLCPGPCAGQISISGYKENIKGICKILRGERKELAEDFKKKMARLSRQKKFEAATLIRNKISAIENLYKGKPKEHEIISLKEILNLPGLPLVIEAIDISSLCSYDAAGSVVVFRDGVPDKDSYRRFLIKEVKGRDDYAMLGEVVRRRYLRLIKEKSKLPDLIIIDGGKGHVMRADKELRALKVSVPVIGIAKRNEEIWFLHQPAGRKNPLIISRSSPCLHLIQRIRDQAHRFAHSYQLIRRRKRTLKI